MSTSKKQFKGENSNSSENWSFLINEILRVTSNFLKNSVDFQDGNILVVNNQPVLKLSDYRQFYVIAVGKAAPHMLADFVSMFPGKTAKSMCIFPESISNDHLETILTPAIMGKTAVIASSHPLTTEKSFFTGKRLIKFLQETESRDLTFFLISGGTSALVEAPAISASLYRESMAVLYRAGLTIHQLNTIRVALSRIKGGQALRHLKGDACSLILSDVPGDNLAVIGSGLTVPRSVFREELSSIVDVIDPVIRQELPTGFFRYIDGFESIEIVLNNRTVKNLLIGCNHDLLACLEPVLQNRGFNTLIITSSLQGSVYDVASVIYSIIEEITRFGKPVKTPACLLLGGETTVTVEKGGKGGRNQELCLAIGLKLRELINEKNSITIICFGTDGMDGNSDYAGAIITRKTITPEEEHIVRKSLKEHDSTGYLLRKDNCLIKTGPTGTNVMDAVIIVIEKLEKSSN
ncbi:MAG: glycerate kinase [Candidatus Odinarchaeota archaeon]